MPEFLNEAWQKDTGVFLPSLTLKRGRHGLTTCICKEGALPSLRTAAKA